MESIGQHTLSLMTEAIFNYIQNLSANHRTDEEIKNQFNDCLDKLESLVAIANSQNIEFKEAA